MSEEFSTRKPEPYKDEKIPNQHMILDLDYIAGQIAQKASEKFDSSNSTIEDLTKTVTDLNDKVNNIIQNLRGFGEGLRRVETIERDIYSLFGYMRADKLLNDPNIEAAVIIPYRGEPTIIKDGVKVQADHPTSIDLDWDAGDRTRVSVES